MLLSLMLNKRMVKHLLYSEHYSGECIWNADMSMSLYVRRGEERRVL